MLTCESLVTPGFLEPNTNLISQLIPSAVSLRRAQVEQLYQAKRMIGGIGKMLFSTDFQNLKMGKIQGLLSVYL